MKEMHDLVDALKMLNGVRVPSKSPIYTITFYCDNPTLARYIARLASLTDYGYVILGCFDSTYILHMYDREQPDAARVAKRLADWIYHDKTEETTREFYN